MPNPSRACQDLRKPFRPLVDMEALFVHSFLGLNLCVDLLSISSYINAIPGPFRHTAD